MLFTKKRISIAIHTLCISWNSGAISITFELCLTWVRLGILHGCVWVFYFCVFGYFTCVYVFGYFTYVCLGILHVCVCLGILLPCVQVFYMCVCV